MLARVLANLIGRIGGPLSFRLIIQPLISAWFALRAGWKDARDRRVPYGWHVISDPLKRRDLLREAWKDIAKIVLGALVIDVLYQIIVIRWLHPEEALIVAAALVIVPYLLFRGLANRVSRHFRKGRDVR